MPSGKIHALSTTLIAGVSGPALVMLAGQTVPHAGAFVAGCMAGLVVNPDLDVEHGSVSWEIMRRSVGHFGLALWQLLWWPYARLIPHRSPLSHFPVLGTLLRLIYILWLPALAWLALHAAYPQAVGPLPALTLDWWWGLAGLALVDTLHTLMDVTWPS